MTSSAIEIRTFACGHDEMAATTAPVRALCPACDAAMRWLMPAADEAKRAETWNRIHEQERCNHG